MQTNTPTVTTQDIANIAAAIMAGTTVAAATKVYNQLVRQAKAGNMAAGVIAQALRHEIGIKHEMREYRAHRRGRQDTGVRKNQSEIDVL